MKWLFAMVLFWGTACIAEVIELEWAGRIEILRDGGVTCYLYRGRAYRAGVDCKGRPTEFSKKTFSTELGWVERADVGQAVCYAYATTVNVFKGAISCVEK